MNTLNTKSKKSETIDFKKVLSYSKSTSGLPFKAPLELWPKTGVLTGQEGFK
jgi:hypothetical protein